MHHYLLSAALPRLHYVPHYNSQYSYQTCISQDNTRSHRRCSGLAQLRLISAHEQGGCEPCTDSSGAQVPSNGRTFLSLCRSLRGRLAWGLGDCCYRYPFHLYSYIYCYSCGFFYLRNYHGQFHSKYRDCPTFIFFEAGMRRFLCRILSISERVIP